MGFKERLIEHINNGSTNPNLTGYFFTDSEIQGIKQHIKSINSDKDFSNLVLKLEMRNKKGYSAKSIEITSGTSIAYTSITFLPFSP